MKQVFKKQMVVILGVIIFAGFAIFSCSDDDKDTPVTKTKLQDSIAVASDLLDNTVEGINDGQFPAAARTALDAAVTAAEGVAANAAATQSEVDGATASLHAAMDTYRAAEIQPVAESDLIAHWAFDEGTGTTAGDNSANEFDGTFKAAPADWGGGMPEWAADRNGDAAKAIHFGANGGNIEVPYNTNLNPTNMTVSLWVNADKIDANNRFLGLHSWVAYKFQLQDGNKPFFTVHATDDKYWDRDATTAIPINSWHHLAVSFGGGNMVFYIDGDVAKTWNDTPGEALSISGSPYNLVIGQDFPTDKYLPVAPDPWDASMAIPLPWGGHFYGFVDELRMYKTVLSDSQVKQIYDREKPL